MTEKQAWDYLARCFDRVVEMSKRAKPKSLWFYPHGLCFHITEQLKEKIANNVAKAMLDKIKERGPKRGGPDGLRWAADGKGALKRAAFCRERMKELK